MSCEGLWGVENGVLGRELGAWLGRWCVWKGQEHKNCRKEEAESRGGEKIKEDWCPFSKCRAFGVEGTLGLGARSDAPCGERKGGEAGEIGGRIKKTQPGEQV